MSRRITVLGVIALLAVIAGGCTFFQPGFNTQPNAPQTIDERFAKIAQNVPGFGGMFLDEQGKLNIYLTDKTRVASAQAEIASVFGNSVPQGDVRVLRGDFDFTELKNWHDRMLALFDIDGVNLTDISEAKNRLTVGVDDIGLADQVTQALNRLGIPRAAVNIVQAERIVPLTTLQDRVRPILAGLQINFPGFLCSIGFNATRQGVSGFVTASHCTNTQGGVESTPYWQPLQSVDPVQIGTEIADPVYLKSTCPPGTGKRKVCRYSDSSFAQYASGISFTLGVIEKTDSVNTGSLTIASSFRVTAKAASNTLVGDTLNKVGRTTGWSQGQVVASCANVGVSGSNIVQLCQDEVSATVGGGDSGSDVFKITNSPQANDVTLSGILWGGNQSGTLFVDSPISNVQQSATELGPLTVCASGFSC